MCERPAFRPKVCYSSPPVLMPLTLLQLYKTGDGPDAGKEEPFPLPDNESKLRRSLDNAETVGLYKPLPNDGPNSAQTHTTSIPPPRNQAPGGGYTAPAPARVARTINHHVGSPFTQLGQEDCPVARSPSPLSVARAVDFFVNGPRSQTTHDNFSFARTTPSSEHTQPMRRLHHLSKSFANNVSCRLVRSSRRSSIS